MRRLGGRGMEEKANIDNHEIVGKLVDSFLYKHNLGQVEKNG